MTNKKQQEKGTKTQSTRSESVQGRTNKTTSRRLVVGRSNRTTITRKKAGAVRKIPRLLPLHDGAGRRRAQEVTLSQSEQQLTSQVVVLETRTPERSDESDRSSVLESDTAVDENTMSDHSASDSEGEDDDSTTSTLSIRASTGETECQKPSTPELIEPYLQSCLHLKQLGGTCHSLPTSVAKVFQRTVTLNSDCKKVALQSVRKSVRRGIYPHLKFLNYADAEEKHDTFETLPNDYSGDYKDLYDYNPFAYLLIHEMRWTSSSNIDQAVYWNTYHKTVEQTLSVQRSTDISQIKRVIVGGKNVYM